MQFMFRSKPNFRTFSLSNKQLDTVVKILPQDFSYELRYNTILTKPYLMELKKLINDSKIARNKKDEVCLIPQDIEVNSKSSFKQPEDDDYEYMKFLKFLSYAEEVEIE